MQESLEASDWSSLRANSEALLKLQPNRSDVEAALQQATAGLTASIRPALLKAPFDAKAAAASQESWAKFLGTPVEITNSIGIKLRLIPPGEFLMGSTDNEAAIPGDWFRVGLFSVG